MRRRRGTDIEAITEASPKIEEQVDQYHIAEEVGDSSFAATLILNFVSFLYSYQNPERYNRAG